MLDEGTTSRTSEQISEALAALGASIDTYSDLDSSHVALSALGISSTPHWQSTPTC
jgi:predicted Zn-dependent peptidase